MKHKFLIETKEYNEVEIELPLYSYYRDDDDVEIYAKITDIDCYKIEFDMLTSISFYHQRNNGYIAAVWLENKSTEEEWKEAVKTAKIRLKQFEL